MPGIAAGLDDGVVVFVDAIGELVLAQILPDVFGWVEFRRIGRQRQERDIGGNLQAFPGVPTRTVKNEDGMSILGNGLGNGREVFVHGVHIGVRVGTPGNA